MTDPEDKTGPADKGEQPEAPEKGATPSILEKAVAKASRDRQAGAADATEAPESPESPENEARPHRSAGRYVVGALVLLLVLAGAYISWPAWGPATPGWMQAALAPVMGAGRGGGGMDAKIAGLEAKIAPLETEISGLKADFAARPVVDPGRLLALDDLVRQHGEWLARLKTEIDTLKRGAGEGPGADQLAPLSQRLDAMEKQLAVLAARPAAAAAPDTAGVDAAAEAVKALDALRSRSGERMSVLERENSALRDVVAQLDKRVAAIEQKPAVPPGAARGNALLLAVGQLREAGRGTAPFDAALQAVEALAGTDEALLKPIAALKPFALTGAPDLIALRLRFNRISARIAHEAFIPKGDGWVDRTLGKLSRIFTFRRTGPGAAQGDDENGRVARAELRLAAGDLAEAVAILEGLKGPALGYAGPWLKEAHARLVVDASIKTLFSEALSRAGRPGEAKGTPGG